MDVIIPRSASSPTSPMQSTESQQNGGKASPPIVCDDSQQQPGSQQPQQNQPLPQPPLPQRTTRYINNSSLSGGANKSSNRSNSLNSSTPKNKALVRSHAVSEETSPPPPDGIPHSVPPPAPNNANTKNGRLRQQNSDQSSSVESSASIDNNIGNDRQCREDTELLDFIIDTLNQSPKDRTLIFRIESDLTNFIKDPKRTSFSFSPMSAYQRMLVHRVSGYFHLDHNVDSSSSFVIVTKTKTTRIPETKFREYIEEQQQYQESNKTVLKRENAGSKKAPEDQNQLNYSHKSRGKSFEERAEDYSRARRRIFNNDQQDPGGYCWSSSTESNTNLPESQGRQGKYMHRKTSNQTSSQLLKVESFETATISRKNKLAVVNKSYSFGGYGATDGSNNVVVGTSNNLGGFNRFSKQDSSSSSSGLSPASSGYKSQSFQSSTENTMTSPNSSTSPQNLPLPECGTVLNIETIPPSAAPAVTPHGAAMHHCILATPVPAPQNGSQPQYIFYPAPQSTLVSASPGLMQGAPLQMQSQVPMPQPRPQNPSLQENVVVWAVTDLNSVPNGSVLIDPRSGLPLKNPDGSTYYYDPTNPPKTGIHPPPQSNTGPSEVMIYQQQQQMQMPVEVVNQQGEMEHVTQWFTHMGIQQQQQHQAPAQVATNQQWGEEYYIPSPHQAPTSQVPNYITAGGAQIVLDPSKMGGTMGLNQQYYPVQAGHTPTTPSQQHHYLMASPSGTTQQAPQHVMMQYSVPTSAAATAPYMVYGMPYGSVAQATAAANYNTLVHYGQQQAQPSPRPMHNNPVHQNSQQPLGIRKDVCYVPTSASSVPSANSTSYLYNQYYGNVLAAAHVQNSGGGPRFPGNPSPYSAQFFPRPPPTGYNNFRSYTKKPRKNIPRNASNSNEKPSNPVNHTGAQQPTQSQPPQQQQQSADKKS